MNFLKLLITTVVVIGMYSCQNKPMITIFETNIKDSATKINERKLYVLKKQTINSDFNYSLINNLDDFDKAKNIVTVFEPISGQFNYFQFQSTYIGESYNDGGPKLFKNFHDVLIVKTDNKNKIIDAYQYTLEWAERPHQYDLFKSSKSEISLTNNLDIKYFKFIRTYELDYDNKDFNESGILKLK